MSGTILLSGALGFTGQHLARSASEAGLSIHALQANLCSAPDLEAELADREFDYVVHLAAISAVTHADELALYEVNLFGTLNLLRALGKLARSPRKVVLASSANIYGNSPRSPIPESASPAPVNHYAMSKLAMEHMSAGFAAELPLVIARPFNYTGIGHDERFVIPKLVRHFREGLAEVELGNIEVEREFNDVRAVCRAYLGLLEHGEPGGIYNICSGNAHSLQHVIDLLGEISGQRIEVRVNPEFVRDNEVHRLCGDPSRLLDCVPELAYPPLEETLRWMLGRD